MLTDRRTDKEDVGYAYTMEYYSAMKKKEVSPFATTRMNFKDITLSEISQKEKDRCALFQLCVETQKKKPKMEINS